MQPFDLIIYPSRATAKEALAGLERIVDLVETGDIEFANALEEACGEGGIDFAFAWAHACNEADYLRDDDHRLGNNAFGIGHYDNATSGTAFSSKRACARYYVAELLLKLRRPIPESLSDARGYAPEKYDRVVAIVGGSLGTFPSIRTIGDLNTRFGPNNREAVWMTDPNGPTAICEKGNALFPNLPAQTSSPNPPRPTQPVPPQEDTVKLYSTEIPGLSGGPLITDYPINILLVPEWRTRNRPGYLALLPRRSVQHGNGNEDSSAAGEARYVYNGAGGRQASYHSSSDDEETWVMVPANEVTWQAADGNGPGNYNGFSNEMVEDRDIWADPMRARRCIAIAADFMGRVSARLDIKDPEQHWTFNFADPNRHDCPNKLRHRYINGVLAWNIYVNDWRAAKADELKRMAGPIATPVPNPVPNHPKFPVTRKRITVPGKIAFKGLASVTVRRSTSTRWECIQGTTGRTYPNRRAPAAVKTVMRRRKHYTFEFETTIAGEVWLGSRAGTFALKKAFSAIN